jgi:hypothetical protein
VQIIGYFDSSYTTLFKGQGRPGPTCFYWSSPRPSRAADPGPGPRLYRTSYMLKNSIGLQTLFSSFVIARDHLHITIALQYRWLLVYQGSHEPLHEELDIQIDTIKINVLVEFAAMRKHTYSPPGDGIWAIFLLYLWALKIAFKLLKRIHIPIKGLSTESHLGLALFS